MKIKNIFVLSMMAGMTLASCNYTDLESNGLIYR